MQNSAGAKEEHSYIFTTSTKQIKRRKKTIPHKDTNTDPEFLVNLDDFIIKVIDEEYQDNKVRDRIENVNRSVVSKKGQEKKKTLKVVFSDNNPFEKGIHIDSASLVLFL